MKGLWYIRHVPQLLYYANTWRNMLIQQTRSYVIWEIHLAYLSCLYRRHRCIWSSSYPHEYPKLIWILFHTQRAYAVYWLSLLSKFVTIFATAMFQNCMPNFPGSTDTNFVNIHVLNVKRLFLFIVRLNFKNDSNFAYSRFEILKSYLRSIEM